MKEDIKNLEEIINLCKEEIHNNDKNITATLDLEDLKIVYGFIILGSIFTTSISLGTSFLQNTSKNEKSYTQIAIIMCITSVLVSKIGFSNLINFLYPIFGYLGFIQILFLISKSN